MEAYLTKFQWEAARFPPRQPVPAIVDLISKVSLGYLRKLSVFSNKHM